MRSLGQFFGHIGRGITSPVGGGAGAGEGEAAGGPKTVRREVQEESATLADGRKVTLRRTTIDEVEVREE